jgi:hypothetical protein
MAIFGDLADLPFPDIFHIFDQGSGRLSIFGVPDHGIFELDLVDGSLRGLRIDGRDIGDPLHVRDRLSILLKTPPGAVFEFHHFLSEQLRADLDLPLAWLAMSLASAVDEISAYRERFPHPRTRFQHMPSAEAPLDAHLGHFAERAMPYLQRGADAEELAREIGVSLEQVQLFLYKLEAAGLVAPVHPLEERPIEAA